MGLEHEPEIFHSFKVSVCSAIRKVGLDTRAGLPNQAASAVKRITWMVKSSEATVNSPSEISWPVNMVLHLYLSEIHHREELFYQMRNSSTDTIPDFEREVIEDIATTDNLRESFGLPV
ncbi:hypothetical protein BKA70DRAFT_1225829 [Coprinopsis sp. MPI-PUGE-AT-0042]|nr:hypothetical protein BKA70DRAFT_1225829 [Coprinopsis sp. MPI-PUGE-AT-0042]